MEGILNSRKLKVFQIYRHLKRGAKTLLVTSWTRRGCGIYLDALCLPRHSLLVELIAFRSLPVNCIGGRKERIIRPDVEYY